mmetsp:Transcript_59901/g.122941  ORF Transcript_59901/g.122941 Transcript_59901/m.122941 type:complete len:248 (+) Transcript_59901:123-866(+)|eukprot:CAMPEP_0181320286 /NCGR_PEP_ID=MMETSP1101-20121128/18040_1 /TAXON_ID=46948 /ORGANISM="Rhodomonas abbreviata, Strain Caron Lab Isolate" /LENGTH=247 /DNA_ID=CAMNT_0023427975 /DNA_START=147 /DNA_END=890 /DNA_ORIENTATION=+
MATLSPAVSAQPMTSFVSVLFMHGLESGPGGSKHRWLCSMYGDSNVTCPNMEMSLYRIDKANSLVRSALRNALTTAPWNLLPVALETSLDGCVEANRQPLEALQSKTGPAVLVGSSWGGAVALHAIEQGLWSGPTILMAPAYSRAVRKCYRSDAAEALLEAKYKAINDRLSDEVKRNCVILHGTEDTTIPLSDSQELSKATGIKLVEIEGGDHRLNDATLFEREQTSGPPHPPLLHEFVLKLTQQST